MNTDWKNVYDTAVVSEIGKICPSCCEYHDGKLYPSRIQHDRYFDEYMYVDPHGYNWCEACEQWAEKYNSLICSNCGLYQDNERHPAPYGGEWCHECEVDECWYRDKEDRHRYEREEKKKKEMINRASDAQQV